MLITTLLDELLEEAKAVGDVEINQWRQRQLLKFVNGNWVAIFHVHRHDRVLELTPNETADLVKTCRRGLAATVAAKLTQ
jgi:hypothetical protein